MPTQPLASKEASLFRQVLKHYETKQYKKGLKAAEQILRKHPKHGETMAMKGLLINCLGRTEEAFAIAKTALTLDMRSHVCWHVYGLLYRAEKNFDEAIKAYKMALRFEPESQQILRDLALLQVQMRDYTGYIESRRTMVIAKSGLRQNWTGLSVAHHLAGNLADAEKVLTKYEETLKQPPTKGDVEHSEALLYKNYIMAEAGEYERALEHLESISRTVLDKLSILEGRAEYNLKLGKMEDAEKAYRSLLERNSEKRAYYAGLEKSLSLGSEERKALYKELTDKYPKSDAPRRIPLDFLEGSEFRSAADEYLQRLLKKGVPSTFANIKALYNDKFKKNTIEELVLAFLDSLLKSAADATQLTNGDGAEKQTLIWTLHFLAMHFDHWRHRDTERASSYIKQALEQSPDTVELRMSLARIKKHAGNYQTAMEEMDKARQVDKSDRYINTKCAKYMLRNSQNAQALEVMGKFTRNDAHGGPLGDLLEMQCIWFITEDGESFHRQGKLGLALKRFHAIYKIFEDWTDDQFDFHSFSLRKDQIRSYIEMVRWEDSLYSHVFFSKAALSAIKIYLLLNDRPHMAHGQLVNGIGGNSQEKFENLSTADRKKALKKAKKEAAKQEQAAAEAAAKAKDDKKGAVEEKKQDTDPEGLKLVQTDEPLEKASMWLKPLLEFSPKLVDAQTLGFEVYMRRKKYILALKCLLAAHNISPDDPILHEQIVRFKLTVSGLKEPLTPAVQSIIDSEFTLLPSETSPSDFNESFLSSHRESAPHVFSYTRTRQFLTNTTKDANSRLKPEEIELISGILDNNQTTLKQSVEGLNILRDWQADIEAYLSKARKRWPEAMAFADISGSKMETQAEDKSS